MKLSRLAKALAAGVNVKRKAKGLLPRAVRFRDQLLPLNLIRCISLIFLSGVYCLIFHCC